MATKMYYFVGYEVYAGSSLVAKGTTQVSMEVHNACFILGDLTETVRTGLEERGDLEPHNKLLITCVSSLYSEEVSSEQSTDCNPQR